MLTEVANVRQHAGDHFRRWFIDKNYDLFVWYKPDSTIYGFQFCFDKVNREKALTWRKDTGFSLHYVEDGEGSPFDNRTPILTPLRSSDDAPSILETFQSVDQKLPGDIRTLVRKKIRAYVKSG